MKSEQLSYTAVIQQDEDGNFLVSFPALLGCVTFGQSYQEALKMGQEVLELWLEELVASGESLPHERGPSSMAVFNTRRPSGKKRTCSYTSTHTQRA